MCTEACGDERVEVTTLAIDDGLGEEDTLLLGDGEPDRLEAAPPTDEPVVGAVVRAAGRDCSGVFG